MKDNNELYEIENRYCPICGNFIQSGSPMHYCLDKDLKEIDKDEDEDMEKDRTYSDKMNEFDKFYNPDNYYDNDEDEEEE